MDQTLRRLAPALANAQDDLMYHGRLMDKGSTSTFWNGKVGLS